MTESDRAASALALVRAPRHSVRTRLMAWNMLTLAIVLGTLGTVTHHLVRSIILASVDRELSKRAEGLAERPDPTPPTSRSAPTPLRRIAIAASPSGHENPRRGADAPTQGARPPADPTRPYSGFDRPQVIDLHGRVVLPANMAAPWDARAAMMAARGGQVFSTVMVRGYPMRVVSRSFPVKGPPAGVVQIPYPLAELNRAVGGLDRALLTLIPLALVLAAAGAAFLASQALRPVRQIADIARRIGRDRLSDRLPVAGRDEFWQLAGVINGMLDRLQSVVERERQFTADASHELRTPVAVVKANTSLCLSGEPSPEQYRRSMEAIDRAAESMSRLVQDLLLLARSDAGQVAVRPVVVLATDVFQEAVRRVARSEGPSIHIAVTNPYLTLVGDEESLVRLFANLLENAVRSTPIDGSITIGAEQGDGVVRTEVVDTGIGIAAEHLSHLGERFYRIDRARTRQDGGAGLGLAIVRSIVEAHQGSISFESAPGAGTTVRVTVPAPKEG